MCVRVCVPHTYICISRLKQQASFVRLILEPMAKCRPDVLKVYIGNLRPDVIKPDVLGLMSRRGLNPVDVIVPVCKGPAAIAFAVFDSPEDASECVDECDGLEDHVGLGAIQAHRGANMGVFSSC